MISFDLWRTYLLSMSRTGTLSGTSTDALDPAPSIYTYSSSRDGVNLFRTYEGRILNASNDLYVLPAGALYIL